jgi:hypothetical protein
MQPFNRIWAIVVTVWVMCGITPIAAQSIDDAARDILTTYDFEPSKMSFQEQAERAPLLSKLWDRYGKSRDRYRPALLSALRSDGAREQLYCDGGMLLLANSMNAADDALGIASIKRCSLAEIQHTPYLYAIHALALKGIDTTDLQFRILERPKYSAFIVMHSLTLGQDYAFLYPFLVREESAYVPALIERLKIEREPVAQKSLVRALWYAATGQAITALREFSKSNRADADVKSTLRKRLATVDDIRSRPRNDSKIDAIRKQFGVPASASERELREKRRVRMRSISDEALYDLEAYTALIYLAIK